MLQHFERDFKPAPGTDTGQIEYALDWVRYLNDPPASEWGRRRAANGHPEPYGVRYFQIDNEPMNKGFTAERSRADRSDQVTWCGARRLLISPGRTSIFSAFTTTSTSRTDSRPD